MLKPYAYHNPLQGSCSLRGTWRRRMAPHQITDLSLSTSLSTIHDKSSLYFFAAWKVMCLIYGLWQIFLFTELLKPCFSAFLYQITLKENLYTYVQKKKNFLILTLLVWYISWFNFCGFQVTQDNTKTLGQQHLKPVYQKDIISNFKLWWVRGKSFFFKLGQDRP